MRILLISLFVQFAIVADALCQARPECAEVCNLNIPVCIDGHAERYLAGFTNQCTLKEEIYCLNQASDTQALVIEDLEGANKAFAAHIARLQKQITTYRSQLRTCLPTVVRRVR